MKIGGVDRGRTALRVTKVAYTTYTGEVRGKLGGVSKIRSTGIGFTLRGAGVGCSPSGANATGFGRGIRSLKCGIMDRGIRFSVAKVAYTTYTGGVRGHLGGLSKIRGTKIGCTVRAILIRCGPRRISVPRVGRTVGGLNCGLRRGGRGTKRRISRQRGRVRGRRKGFLFSTVLSFPLL